jgi:hypothetical protein
MFRSQPQLRQPRVASRRRKAFRPDVSDHHSALCLGSSGEFRFTLSCGLNGGIQCRWRHQESSDHFKRN